MTDCEPQEHQEPHKEHESPVGEDESAAPAFLDPLGVNGPGYHPLAADAEDKDKQEQEQEEEEEEEEEQEEPYMVEHDLQPRTFSQLTYCNVCERLLVGVARQGVWCCRCGACMHERCAASGAAAARVPCKVCAGAPAPARAPPQCPWPAHQWQAGNTHLVPPGWPPIVAPTPRVLAPLAPQEPFASPAACVVCGGPAGSGTGLADRRCMWCHRACHSSPVSVALPPTPPTLEGNHDGGGGEGTGEAAEATATVTKEAATAATREGHDCEREGDMMPCTLGPLAALVAPPNLVVRDAARPGEFYVRRPREGVEVAPGGLRPLLCFINSRSGAQEGVLMRRQLEGVLNPLQVFDLLEAGAAPGPARGFRFVREYAPADFAVLVCGGDGTCGWVLAELARAGLTPAVAVVPLGTGNDLARALGWGGGFDPAAEHVAATLLTLLDPTRVREQPLDRWCVHTEPRFVGQQLAPPPRDRLVNNYWSIGLDARIALDFHRARESDPAAFTGRFTNKVQYVKFAALDLVCPNTLLPKRIELYIDGVPVPLPADAQGLVVLNLPSCYGGRNLWGDSLTPDERARGLTPLAMDDMALEVVALRSTVQLGEINTGLALPQKIGQGQDIRIRLLNHDEQCSLLDRDPATDPAQQHDDEQRGVVYSSIACQFDGEPYLQPMDCSLVFSHVQQAKMIRRIK